MNKIYHVKCEFIVDGRLLTTTASARKKKLAFRDAARRMLEKLERLPKPEAERAAMGDCPEGEFLIGMKVRAKWNDTERFYDGVIAKKNDDNTYNVFWPQWRNQTENIKFSDMQRQKIRVYKKGRLRVRDGKAGIDVTCQPKGIVITNKGEQPDMEVNDTLVAINNDMLKGLMPEEQAKKWKEHMTNGVAFLIERETKDPKKVRGPALPVTDAQALNQFFMRNRKVVKLPPQYNIVQEMGMPHNRMYTIECVLEFNDHTERVKATARSKKKAKQEAAKKMVEKLGDRINQKSGGGGGAPLATAKRKASGAAPSQPAAKRVKTESSGRPNHELLQEKAEKAYDEYLKLANAGETEKATKKYKEYESTYKQYADEYREYSAKNP